MAKNTQEAEVIVTMNGQAAKKAAAELTAEYERLTQAALDARKAGNDALGDKLDADARKLMKDIEITRRETKKFADVMKNINGASLKELRSAAKQLQSEINKLAPGTQAFIEKSKQLQQVNTRIRQLTNEFKGLVEEEKQATFSLKGLADGFNRYFGMATTAIASITGLSMAFRKAAEEAAKLDDVYADVMKTTGLLHEEVADLDKELMKIDTRTSREQLLLLARDAGKLGITGKEDILGFVRAADQIQVALGEDLGEGAIRNLGKIADVLGYTKSMGIEKSLLSIASSINAVGQASTASESYLVDFTQRMAGVGQLAHLSAADIIGFASGLDQSAMKVEMSATAFQKFMMKLYSEPEKFAQYAHKSVSEFADLMKNDANAAMIEVLKGLREIGDMSELTKHFDEMGLDGARTVQVLGAMASNLNAVTDAQRLANEEFEKATSVSEEYATKNNNLQAQLEKARKEFHNASITLGQSLNPIMLKSTKATTYLIKALAQYGKEIKTVIIVIAALTLALKAKAIWLKAVAVWNATLRTGSLALAAAQALLTGNVTRAAAAWAMMNTAMKASVIGVVTAAISGLIIMFQRLNKKQEETNYLKEKSIALDKKVEDAGKKEIAQVKQLSDVVHDQMRSYYERNKALEELKKLVPDYQASLTKEGELINDNIEALDNYIQKIKQTALEKLLADEIADLAQREVEANMNKEEHQNALDEAKTSYSGDSYMGHSGNEGMVSVMEGLLAADEVVLEGIAEERKQLTDKIQKMIAAGDLVIDPSNGGGGGGTPSGKGESPYQKALKDLEKSQREEENILKQSYINREITAEEYEKSMREINLKYLQQKVELAQQFGEDESSAMANWLNAQISAADLANKEIEALLKQREDWEKAQQAELEAYQKQLEELKEEAEKVRDWLNPSAARMKEMDGELAALDKLHQAKLLSEEEYEEAVKQLRKKYADEDLAEKISNVQKFADQLNNIMSEAANVVSSIKDAELAKAEATYQAELTAAGNNAAKREAVEENYQKKQLEIQKKYADIDMVMKIAKTTAAGAVAAIRAYEEGGPYAGPFLAAAIAATTAYEIATIIQQRNAIKNASVNSTGSSNYSNTDNDTSSGNIGSRVITGYKGGGSTKKSASDNTPVGIVHANEWVAPAWLVRKEPVMFSNLERYRRAGSQGRSGSSVRGFADGGFTSNGIQGGMDSYNRELMNLLKETQETNELLRLQLAQGIHADVALSEINRKQKILNKFKQKTSAL